VTEQENSKRLRSVLESVEMMLGYPTEHPEAFDMASLRVTVRSVHGIVVLALREKNTNAAERTYRDADGNECSLVGLCRKEPEWAANMIIAHESRLEK
jgi:hypothetical protein